MLTLALLLLAGVSAAQQPEESALFEVLSIDQLTQHQRNSAGLSPYAQGTEPAYLVFNSGTATSILGHYPVAISDADGVSYIKIRHFGEYNGSAIIRGASQHGPFVAALSPTGVSGYGHTSQKRYIFTEINNDLSALEFFDVGTQAGLSDVVADVPPSDELPSTTEACIVDVLFLRSSSADALLGQGGLAPDNFEDLVDLIASHTNVTLANSAIGTKQINAMIHPQPIDG